MKNLQENMIQGSSYYSIETRILRFFFNGNIFFPFKVLSPFYNEASSFYDTYVDWSRGCSVEIDFPSKILHCH